MTKEKSPVEEVKENVQAQTDIAMPKEKMIRPSAKLRDALLALMDTRPFNEVFQMVEHITKSELFTLAFVDVLANYIGKLNYRTAKPYIILLQNEVTVVDENGIDTDEPLNLV